MYQQSFRNRYFDHDFALIQKVIGEYFPVGRGKRITPEAASSFAGFQKRGELYNSEFLNEKAYRAKWGKLSRHIKKLLKRKVWEFPDMMGGGFVGEVTIFEDRHPDFERKKSLRFYVSILGPFFSIHGIDSVRSLLATGLDSRPADKGHFDATVAITVAPIFEYLDDFKILEAALRVFFPGYLMVPHCVGMSTIRNISNAEDYGPLRPMDTIYEALFGTMAVHACPFRGDSRYGMDDWLKPFNKKERALIERISKDIVNARTDISIHKVWKLSESNRLKTYEVTGNITVGLGSFEVIDLCSERDAIVVSDGRGTPALLTYAIKNNVITIPKYLSFRIVEISSDTLVLNLILNVEYKSASVKGEALQLRYNQMTKVDAMDGKKSP
jgi:hypothetical protein